MTSERPLLCLDTSTPVARLAVLSADGTPRVIRERAAIRHASHLLPSIDEILKEAGLTVAELGGIACGAGPGSFTGLRVALAVAKGLALPTGLPLVLISSLEALAHDLAAQQSGPAPGLYVPCLDAGKDQVYAQPFEADLRPTGEPWTIGPTALVDELARQGKALVLGGAGVDRYRDTFAAGLPAATLLGGDVGPTAVSLGRLALVRLARGESDDLAAAVPVYGRPPDITRPKAR